MAKEIKQLECLSQISSAIIANPSYSLSSFGILKDPGTKQLIYTGNIESSAKADYATVAAASIALTGAATIVTTSALSSFGLIAGAGVLAGAGAAAGGVSATGVGLAVAPFILLWGYKIYKQKKREQEQKERMYRELVAKLQAAINRQKEINRKLEERLRQQQASTEQLKAEIARLRQEIANLMELIEVLTQQINNFKNAA
jgi:DNA repair exonuclease SbcCD ATPase subunit